eukprot:scaffold250006_cov36-Tisochrysis_lutea.AAC.2
MPRAPGWILMASHSVIFLPVIVSQGESSQAREQSHQSKGKGKGGNGGRVTKKSIQKTKNPKFVPN